MTTAGKKCRSCNNQAHWAIDGDGAMGERVAATPLFCKRHAEAKAFEMNAKSKGYGTRGEYQAVKV